MIRTVTRSSLRLSVVAALCWLATLPLAGPASAEVPEGWPANEPVSALHAFLLIGGVTLAVILVVTVMAVGPALARGESLAPGVAPVEDQWLGGPRPAAGELAGPDNADSAAGGASARW